MQALADNFILLEATTGCSALFAHELMLRQMKSKIVHIKSIDKHCPVGRMDIGLQGSALKVIL